jgi:hypothetical protein
MSEITTRIRDCRAGRAAWELLRDWLATRIYPTPTRYTVGARDPYSDEKYPHSPSTWDDLDRMCNVGLVTRGEWLEIIAEAD